MRSGSVNPNLTRGYGTLGGLAIIGAALFAVPSTLLLEPLPPAEAYLSVLAALTTGLVCLALPWERLDPRWLHVLAVLTTVEAAWAVAVFGQAYMAFYFLIAVSVAYVTPDARTLMPHLLLIGLALLGPVVYGPADSREALQVALVVYPLLCLTAGIFAYLRQRMVADHRSYRLFAEETLALADRIAGRSITTQRPALAGEPDDLPEWSRRRFSARASAIAAGVFAVPLVSAGLAVAGVRLPAFAADTFGDVGIDLPNQNAAQKPAEGSTTHDESTRADRPSGGSRRDGASSGGDARSKPSESGGKANGKDDGGSEAGVTSTPVTGGAPDTSSSPTASGSAPPDTGSPSVDVGGGSSDLVSSGGGSLGQALEDTVAGLGGLLGDRDREAAAAESAE